MSEERRLVTVLFADVAGSTSMGESLDPEDLRALLTRFFSIARDVIEGHGGTVEKFMGDAVMAVFGLPQAHGDDADRALAAALEVRDRVRTEPSLGDRLPIRIGVNTGEVVATTDTGTGDGLVTGDAVNVAARLQQHAGEWGILAGERTARAAPTFAFGAAQDVEARGKSAPVKARLVLGRATRVTRRVPLVGRDADLAQLRLVADRVFRERRPFLVSVAAPAGTGKTRLLEEFLDHLRDLAPDVEVAISQCLPYGQRLTYWPLRAVLQRLAGIGEDAAPDEIRRALEDWLLRLGDDDAARDGELLAATIGAGDTDVGESTSVIAAWKRAIELAATRAPLVIVFEDLHWSSDSLLDLVEAILQPRGDLPLLMIALTRPELLDRRPRWGGGRRDYISLSLEPLDDASVASLVHHLLEDASPTLVDAVVKRAEGNPFYAGEIVRSVAERMGPGGTQDTDVTQLLATLPDTVQATVLARLDELPTAERRVLQIGAVFGRSFRAAGVSAVAPDLTAEADAALELLLDRDMVRPSGADGFTFRHILIRDVAYQTLPRVERARLHAAAGRWLESKAGDKVEQYAELIAYHYREAAGLGSLLDPDLVAEIRASAVDWLSRAAEVAMAAGAQLEAARHLRGAIELAPPQLLPELYERLALTWGNGDQVVEALESAIRLAEEQARPTNDLGRLYAQLLVSRTRFQGAISARLSPAEMDALRDHVLRLADEVDDELVRARLLIADSFRPFYLQGQNRPVTDADLLLAESEARDGLAIAERHGAAELSSTALDALTAIDQQRGDWRAALADASQRLEYEGRIGLGELLDADSMVAWLATAVGDLSRAQAVASHRLSVLQPGQMPSTALHLCSWWIYALGLSGDWDDALATGRRAVRLWIEVERAPAGYALGGFVSALVVARARRDEQLEEIVAEPIRMLLAAFDASPRNQLMRRILERDLDPDTGALMTRASIRPDYTERMLAFWSDNGVQVPEATLVELAEHSSRVGTDPLLGQIRRAQGLAGRDPKRFGEALAIFDRTGMLPSSARVRCELGLLTGDQELLAAGMAALRSLRDLEQVDRYEAAASG